MLARYIFGGFVPAFFGQRWAMPSAHANDIDETLFIQLLQNYLSQNCSNRPNRIDITLSNPSQLVIAIKVADDDFKRFGWQRNTHDTLLC